ncbi:MAG: 2-phospho-L-lactate guanylyltransferase, partial [Nocardioides sp.]
PAALCGDLPALRPADLATALGLASESGPAYVADADGLGTTLFTSPLEGFHPCFGPDSRALHDGMGASPIEGELSSLRRDVDDLDDLRAAAPLGLGARTATAARSALLIPG